MTLEAYLPILIFAVLVTIFGVASIGISSLLAPKRPTAAKLSPYECGITPVDDDVKERFPIKFYVIAMLFIIFDIETVFLFPWAVVFKKLGVAGLIEMGIFIAFLFGAYIYVWRRKGLEWE
ncbi:MAG TPA: NADH-quinone oxidoreductase subunit A [Actinomycetota bacterium]|nr:NADH-quinone oxidoreductase subunit A [Actinomycetota bacterium]